MSERILVVDDEEIIRESLTFILRKEGYEVDEAKN
jgi:CheY-like chemotaxis protein